MPPEIQPSSRREFLGAAAFVLAGLAATSRLPAADASKTPVKRPPNPYVYKFNIGKIEAFSISDGHMLFRQGLDLMWPEADRPTMKDALVFNRERLDALPLYVNIMGLKIGDEVALIDAGFGERHPNPNFGWFAEGLRQLGINPNRLRPVSSATRIQITSTASSTTASQPSRTPRFISCRRNMISGAARIPTSLSLSATRSLCLTW